MSRRKVLQLTFALAVLLASGISAFFVRANETSTVQETKRSSEQQRCPSTPPQSSKPQETCIDPQTPGDTAVTPPAVVPQSDLTPIPQPDQSTLPTPSEISRGNQSKKQVIFTFDAGAGSQSLQAILTALQQHGVTSTFFVTGKWAQTDTTGLRLISSAGHEIFNHTYSHPNLTTLDDTGIAAELSQGELIIKGVTGKSTLPYFRPPYGARNMHVLDVAWSQGFRSVYWTVDALDWKEGVTAGEVSDRILNNLNPGTIYLMHVGDTITGQILDEILSTIQSRGYEITSLTGGL